MNSKKIMGYKLIKEYPNSQSLGYIENSLIDNLDKYPEFWEPIYEEIFKVGDWIYGNILGAEEYNYEKHPVKVIEVFTDGFRYDLWSNPLLKEYGYDHQISSKYPFSAIVRKATPEEIAAIKPLIIKMYSSNKGEFEIEIKNRKAYYRPDNKELTKEFIAEVLDWFDDSAKQNLSGDSKLIYSLRVQSLKVGCMENTKKEDWINVYNNL